MDPNVLPKSERNFYWWHLRGLCERSLEGRLTLRGHTGIVGTVAFRPDGRMLASGDQGNAIRLWDPATGNLVRRAQRSYSLTVQARIQPR